MPNDKLKIAVIGMGPIGSIISAYLSRAGAEIFASDLPHRIEQLNENGIQIDRDDELVQYPVKTINSIKELSDIKPDCILVALKASILDLVMPDIASSSDENCMVISVQNGIGTEDKIASFVPPERVCRMVVNYAGGNDEDGVTSFLWFSPPNVLGPHLESENAGLKTIVDLLNASGLTSEYVDSKAVKQKAFLKTVLNAALMPICAVMKLTMKQAMHTAATRELATQILSEGLKVGEKLGYDYGDNILNICVGYLDKGGDHHPSMSVDIEHKRPTEIDFINGKILELGSAFDDLDLPTNRVFVSLIMTQEVLNGTRKSDDFPDYLL